MKVFIRRDTSDEHARYLIDDEFENPLYNVTGRMTASGELMKIMSEGYTAAKIRDMRLPVVRAYSVSYASENIKLFFTVRAGEVRVRFSGISWRIRGDVLGGSYDILDADSTVICTVYKHFSKNYSELTIFDTNRELFCIAAAICVESLNLERVADLQMT